MKRNFHGGVAASRQKGVAKSAVSVLEERGSRLSLIQMVKNFANDFVLGNKTDHA